MAMGHFLLTFQSLFYPGLALIVIGNGFFLPAIPAQIGDLYETDDPRYAGAFNIYYVGINIGGRSEEHTSELQSLMRISYAVFCLKKKTTHITTNNTPIQQERHVPYTKTHNEN